MPVSVTLSVLVPDTLPVYTFSLNVVVVLSLLWSVLLSSAPWSLLSSLPASLRLSVIVSDRMPVKVFSLSVVVLLSVLLSLLLSCHPGPNGCPGGKHTRPEWSRTGCR